MKNKRFVFHRYPEKWNWNEGHTGYFDRSWSNNSVFIIPEIPNSTIRNFI